MKEKDLFHISEMDISLSSLGLPLDKEKEYWGDREVV
jgi:hypothetical protein